MPMTIVALFRWLPGELKSDPRRLGSMLGPVRAVVFVTSPVMTKRLVRTLLQMLLEGIGRKGIW